MLKFLQLSFIVLFLFALAGHNCSTPADDRKLGYKAPTIPFLCELQLTNHQSDIDVADLFAARPVFDLVSGITKLIGTWQILMGGGGGGAVVDWLRFPLC